ncbi:hypothetical protein [Streptoalloteichus hindustanus]|uniref:Uncharacterized protein n=1 Tax=Streptoalloteichus hindustanus TaxID=2017 RepID=A0A1M4XKK1_STRHI|nr:hypothetical protein [Streptoalloteichus hindustanus]SHE93936.1 hypothetical protein SAMN05444320_10232 [Streptoalloteichus hindustanus]
MSIPLRRTASPSAASPVEAVDPSAPPTPVRRAFTLWLVAVGAGVFETVLAVGGLVANGPGSGAQVVTGLVIRIPVFVAAVVAALHMRRGRPWGRTFLALGLGVLGTASMVVPPISALAQGRSLGSFVEKLGAMDLVFGMSRVVHVLAVLTAVSLMFLPAANAYFRSRRAN